MKLLLRVIVFILVGLGLFWLLSCTNPKYTVNNIYLVNGYCTDVQYERIHAKNGDKRVYIVMEDGTRYYIYDYLWKALDEKQKNIKGSEISFYASDKGGGHWAYDHLYIAFDSDESGCLNAIKLINQKNNVTKVIGLSLYFLVSFLFYLTPEILRQTEKKSRIHARNRKRKQ